MLKDIVAVKPLSGYQLWLSFEDGVEGVVDISKVIDFRGIFASLENVAYFAQVQVHPELGTIFWENDADLDPDVLYSLVTKQSISNYAMTGQRPIPQDY